MERNDRDPASRFSVFWALAGGICLFDDRASAQACLDMHGKRLQASGIEHIHARVFDVNEELSAIDRAPMG